VDSWGFGSGGLGVFWYSKDSASTRSGIARSNCPVRLVCILTDHGSGTPWTLRAEATKEGCAGTGPPHSLRFPSGKGV